VAKGFACGRLSGKDTRTGSQKPRKLHLPQPPGWCYLQNDWQLPKQKVIRLMRECSQPVKGIVGPKDEHSRSVASSFQGHVRSQIVAFTA
jgi:hypothetical protein